MKIKLLRLALGLPGVLFLVIGLGWVVNPETAAANLGMVLLDGVGRSSQIGDMASFFLTISICVLMGTVTLSRQWFYAPVMLLGGAAIFRTLAWLVHEAALAVPMIGVEVVLAIFLWIVSGVACKGAQHEV